MIKWNEVVALVTPILSLDYAPLAFSIMLNITLLLTLLVQKAKQRKLSHANYKRFEKIREIKYGFVEYPPLIDHTKNNKIQGIGIDLLKEIFENDKTNPIKVQRKRKVKWNEIEQSLYFRTKTGYEIDVIATPLFETNTRSKQMLFCTPIFFSEVGIYVNQKSLLYEKIGKEKLSLLDAIEKIIAYDGPINVVCIKGEISQKMFDKYLKGKIQGKVTYYDTENREISDLIDKLIESKDNDIVFTERYQAEMSDYTKISIDQDKRVVNILKPHSLHYPVSFALRKGEYALRNLINIKLMSLDRNRILDIIINVIHAQTYTHPLVDELKQLRAKLKTELNELDKISDELTLLTNIDLRDMTTKEIADIKEKREKKKIEKTEKEAEVAKKQIETRHNEVILVEKYFLPAKASGV